MSENVAEEPPGDRIKFILTPESTERKLAFSTKDAPAHYDLQSSERTSLDEEEEGTPRVLDPNHPLLERFQLVLKEHLKRQIEHLSSEVFELETGAKKKKQARELLGIETYEAQQSVNRQQQELEMYITELDNVCSATEQMELELEQAKNLFREKRLTLLETEKKELHLRTEVEGLNLLIHQMTEWEDEVESELTVNQRVFEKTEKDQKKLAGEQRQLDTIIYRLMKEIWRLEEELETLDMQLRVKEEERENLAESVAASNVEIEAVHSEHRCLLQSWNTIILMIGQRDKRYNTLKTELDALNEKLHSLVSELEKTKKVCQYEMMENEKLVDIKSRVQMELDNSTRLFEIECKKRDVLEAQMSQNQMIIDQTERDISVVSAENINKSNEVTALMKEIEKLSRQKLFFEEQILKTLEDQLTNNKAAKYLNKMVYQIQEKNRDLEINVANLENMNAKTITDIEAQKLMNEETQRFLDEMLKQQHIVETEVKERTVELEKLQFMAGKKQRDLDLLTTKIDVIVNRQDGVDASPEEVKIITLEKNIVDAKEKIKQIQKFWLRQQGYVVSLSQQRQDQINDMNLLKKQMLLLFQKNLKINDELDGYKKQVEKTDRLIKNLENQLVILNNKLEGKRGCKETLTQDNILAQDEYVENLQESEMDSLKIKADIVDIEEDKINLSDDLLELNREALTWEKKIQMASETKKNMDTEKGAGGEVGNMKAEIHRMKVRFSQLKRAQDKLIHDLECCVSRRDAIITLAEAREKRDKGGSEKTRINFARKLDDMRNTVTKLENEVESVEKKLQEYVENEKLLFEEIEAIEKDTEHTKQKTERVLEHIEEVKTLRQRNLEVLVLKQKKLKVYSELSKNRHPYITYRSESAINLECDKQRQANNKLINVVENLLSDFPQRYQVFTRIHNTLILPLKFL